MTTADKDNSVAKEEDLETLIFKAVKFGENSHWICLCNKWNEIEQEILINGTVKKLELESDKVVALDDHGIAHEWLLNDLNHSPREYVYNERLRNKQIRSVRKFFKNLSRKHGTIAAVSYYRALKRGELDMLPILPRRYSKHDLSLGTYQKIEVQVPRPAIKITPLGIGNANPKNKFGNSCFLLEANFSEYLIDFPKDTSWLGDDKLVSITDFEPRIIITHLHNDHIGSLVDYLLTRGPQSDDKFKRNIYIEQQNEAKLRDIFETLGLKTCWSENKQVNFRDFVNYHVFNSGDIFTPDNNTELKIESMRNVHGDVPSVALKLSYNGKKVGISGDCNEALSVSNINDSSTRFDNCDLVFHEATMGNNPVHTNIDYLEKKFAHLKNKMFLYHIEDKFYYELFRYKNFESKVFPIAKRGMTYRV